ncbi:homeobox-leucine zipper protein ROC5-like [Iris pallida]|uniref:Homeobox-leucine zipper protein ROC5-like n=1 Tax=Iris pallida TaxID=29817 RepID=A0AAX6H792_IRIPA|nr:homeobox-leucine zipper protein ROC5-like [Iris pallida]
MMSSFGGLFDSGVGLLADEPFGGSAKFSSPGLSLALQTNKRGSKEDLLLENDSKSGSDNVDGVSGDDLDENENPRKKKKRYHRHTPQQIQELEALFKECPHPDDKQRLELSKRLSLETRQVKFWFQNRRTQMKTQIERHENAILKQENEKLRMENIAIRDAMRNPICSNCGGAAVLGESSLEEQHHRIENARLKDELDRVCALAGKFIGRPISSLSSHIAPKSSLELAVGGGNGGFGSMGSYAVTMPSAVAEYTPLGLGVADRSHERSMLLEMAVGAMDELVKMAEMGEPLWVQSFEGGLKETLNFEEYQRVFPRCGGMRPVGFAVEATRETGLVIINSAALVETLMDATRWADMFPSMIAKTTTTGIISGGIGGTRNGILQLMHAELQILSPLVPVRDVEFLRFCKQLAEGVWAVVDVCIDGIRESSPTSAFRCRKLPSGCLMQDMANGYSKVTWVEHTEYDETAVHQLYRPLLRSGMGLGAQRWLATLQRRCEGLAMLLSSTAATNNPTVMSSAITASGKRSMLKLAQRMMDNFCAGVCASSVQKWSKLSIGTIGEDVRVMTRQSLDDPGEPPGVVLSAATAVWIPVSPHRLFDFLRDESLRSEWDILSNGGPMQEMAHIAKGQDQGNAVSLLRASTAPNGNQQSSSMLILQETCTDASGSMVVYAPVDIPAMHLVMNGGDSSYVALLPSGFAIMPDGTGPNGQKMGGSGSLLTVAFQILVNSLPSAKLTVESVETVNNLISCTVQKIKAALVCGN